jgi:AraC-like DNA-binding protein
MAWSILYILGAIQGVFLAFLLFQTRHKKWPGNLYLSVLLLIVASLLGIFSARILLGTAIYPWLFWPITATPALIGPCFYLYVRSIYTQSKALKPNALFHLLPFVLLILIFLPETLAEPAMGLQQLDASATVNKTFYTSYIKSILIIGYLLYCLKLLASETIKIYFPLQARKFLQFVIGLFVLISISGSALSTLYWLAIFDLPWADNLELGSLTILTYLLAYYVFFYDVKPLIIKDKYVNSALTKSARVELATTIKQLMEEQMLFLNENYSAKFLATELGISEQYLSEVLALELNSNFNSFSNQYRFNHFKQQLQLQANNNLLDLAHASGFKSKSSFNRVIKDYSGMTPKAFRIHLLNKD